MYKKLYRGSVQMDGSGTRNEVEELGDLGVKRGCPYRFHGGDNEVKLSVSLNLLNVTTREHRVNIVADFLIGWD